MWEKELWVLCGQELVRMLPQVLFSSVTTAGPGLWSFPSEMGAHCCWFPRSGDWETWVEQVQPQIRRGPAPLGQVEGRCARDLLELAMHICDSSPQHPPPAGVDGSPLDLVFRHLRKVFTQIQWDILCGGLNDNGPYRLMYLNDWSPVGRTV